MKTFKFKDNINNINQTTDELKEYIKISLSKYFVINYLSHFYSFWEILNYDFDNNLSNNQNMVRKATKKAENNNSLLQWQIEKENLIYRNIIDFLMTRGGIFEVIVLTEEEIEKTLPDLYEILLVDLF